MGLIEAHAGLKGKRAAIIGAGGVGRASTVALASAGVHIPACDVDEEAVRSLVSELEAIGTGVDVIPLNADVADPAQLDGFYAEVGREFGKLDIVVNVAGGGMRRKLFMESTRDEYAHIIRMNYGYVIDSIEHAVPLLRKSGGGSIISFTTIEAHRGAAGYSVYAGAKAATTNFSRAVAVELAAENIRVNLIAPDTTPAQGSFGALGPETLELMNKLSADAWDKSFGLYVPQGRNPSPEELANAILYLASGLSSSVIGQTVHVDGGTMAAGGFLNWPNGDGWGPAPLAGTVPKMFG